MSTKVEQLFTPIKPTKPKPRTPRAPKKIESDHAPPPIPSPPTLKREIAQVFSPDPEKTPEAPEVIDLTGDTPSPKKTRHEFQSPIPIKKNDDTPPRRPRSTTIVDHTEYLPKESPKSVIEEIIDNSLTGVIVSIDGITMTANEIFYGVDTELLGQSDEDSSHSSSD